MDNNHAAILGGILVLAGVAIGAHSQARPVAVEPTPPGQPTTTPPPVVAPADPMSCSDTDQDREAGLGKAAVIRQLEEAFREI